MNVGTQALLDQRWEEATDAVAEAGPDLFMELYRKLSLYVHSNGGSGLHLDATEKRVMVNFAWLGMAEAFCRMKAKKEQDT